MATVNCLEDVQNTFFCVQEKKETHAGLGQLNIRPCQKLVSANICKYSDENDRLV